MKDKYYIKIFQNQMVRRLKDLTIHIMKCNMNLLLALVIFVKDTGMKARMDCARLTHHGPLRLGNDDNCNEIKRILSNNREKFG